MWPLGHAAGAYLLYALSTRSRHDAAPAGWAVVALAVGCQFPDLVDKPLAWYLGVLPTGRSLAHSLLVVGPLCAGVVLLARRYDRGEWGIAFASGVLSHLLLDTLPVLWGRADPKMLLWPALPVDPYEGGPPTILGLFVESLSDAYFLSEFVLAAIAFVLWRRHGYPGLDALVAAGRRGRAALAGSN